MFILNKQMMHGLIYRLTITRTHKGKVKVILWWRVKLIRKTHKRKRFRFLVYFVIYAFIFFLFQWRRLPFVQLLARWRKVKTSIVVAERFV